ncbi:MAG: family ATPase [Pseudomonas sp.]|nr:family ATPase [Pseudomonas sp.]
MNASADLDWTSANQQLLVAEFARVHALLGDGVLADAQNQVDLLRADMQEPAAIDTLVQVFELSRFERDLVLLAAGVEMDTGIALLCAQVSGHLNRAWASFSLALAMLPAPHWSALSPVAPLRRWRLVDIDENAGLTAGRLRLDERVLHFIGGLNYLDTRLQPLLEQIHGPGLMCRPHEAAVDAAIERLHRYRNRVPTLLLSGDDPLGQQDVAAAIAQRLGVALFILRASDIPGAAHEQAAFAALWQREAALLSAALLITHQGDDSKAVVQLVGRIEGLVIVAGRTLPTLDGETFFIDRPDTPEQRRLWQQALGERATALAPLVDALAGQYRLGARRIAAIAAQATGPDTQPDLAQLHRACRGEGSSMNELARPIDARAGWDDLVLPAAQLMTLQQIAVHTRHRLTVHHDWGFAGKSSRGLGIAALFWGDSGTGKTLAAEVLAKTLDLALFAIDLSAVVSKYIGETEKNLRKVFDDAEELGAILLFDEADALFGKRSEVKDSHDRYANIEVSYLLQRMEAYRGLAILTTNNKSALDSAFARRLRFIVHFPFPDEEQREALWRGVFPTATPLESLDYPKLARLAVPGGTIRNIALAAAFLAADAGTSVGMQHLLRAAHIEAAKRDKPMSESEIRGWV